MAQIAKRFEPSTVLRAFHTIQPSSSVSPISVPSTLECTWITTSSAVAEMGDRGHRGHGPKRGAAVPLSLGAGTPSNTMWPEPRSTSVPRTRLQPSSHLATIGMGQKLGGSGCALFLKVAGFTSNIMSRRPGLPPYQVAS